MNYLNKETKTERHPHADLIIQWANNPKLNFQFCCSFDNTWKDVWNPSWDKTLKYRIKPEPKPDVIVYTNIGKSAGGYYHSFGVWKSDENEIPESPFFHTEFKGQNTDTLYKDITKLKLTYDGETGKLKKVVEI